MKSLTYPVRNIPHGIFIRGSVTTGLITRVAYQLLDSVYTERGATRGGRVDSPRWQPRGELRYRGDK